MVSQTFVLATVSVRKEKKGRQMTLVTCSTEDRKPSPSQRLLLLGLVKTSIAIEYTG